MPIARGTPPPPARTLSAPNWAAPDQTIADIASAGTTPMIGAASSPKVTPSAAVGSSSGAERRTATDLVVDMESPPTTDASLMALICAKPLV